jgi:hypothetical protein
MKRKLSKYVDRLFFKKWIIGIFRGNIEEIIRSKTFNPDINWLFIESNEKYFADPFLLDKKDENFNILLEDVSLNDGYGKISLLILDKNFNKLKHKILLDTKSHLSYPFFFTENNKIFVFPEAAKSGKLSCYEYDPVKESLIFLKDILDLPLRDSSILKRNEKYWIFGTMCENETEYDLHVFYSDSLLGPYVPHMSNPVKSGLDGTRSAGNYIEVDGNIYRPTQNCKNEYGESITINRITELSEISVVEESYLDIFINRKNRHNKRMHTIHTINGVGNNIIVDGVHWTFSPGLQLKTYLRNRRKEKQSKVVKTDHKPL